MADSHRGIDPRPAGLHITVTDGTVLPVVAFRAERPRPHPDVMDRDAGVGAAGPRGGAYPVDVVLPTASRS